MGDHSGGEAQTAGDAATWMFEQIRRSPFHLYQDDAAEHIRRYFGACFVTPTEAGGLSINGDVLEAFRFLCGDRLRWTGGRYGGAWTLED